MQPARLLLLAVLAVHLTGVSVVFPLAALARKELPHRGDYSYWLYNTTVIDHVLADSWQMWGYNPYVSAGYPDGGVLKHPAQSGRAWELLTHLFSPVSFGFGFKLYPFLCMAIAPFLVLWSCRSLRFAVTQTSLVVTLAVAFWWSLWFVRWGVDNGTISFTVAAFGVPLVVARFWSFCRSRTPTDLVAFVAVVALFVWVHPFTPVLVGIPLATLYGLYGRHLGMRGHLLVLVGVLLVCLSTAPWTASLFLVEYRDSVVNMNPMGRSSGLAGIVRELLGSRAQPLVLLSAVLLAGCGVRRWQQTGYERLAVAWAAGAIWIGFVGRFGSHVSLLQDLLPGRYAGVLYVFLMLPAAHGLETCLDWLRLGGGTRVLRVSLVIVLSAALVVQGARLMRQALYEPVVNARRVVSPMSPEGVALIDWLGRHTSKEGRVLFEDALRWEADFSFVPGLIALQSDREFIGGPYWDIGQRYGLFANYVDGQLFNRRIVTLTVADLNRYLDLYNIKWIVAGSAPSVEYYDQHTELFAWRAAIGPMRIYEVQRSASFFHKGTGHVEATFNRLILTDLAGGELVLRYHWIPTLRSTDGSRLWEVKLLDDPNGFIGIAPRSAELTIYNAYRRASR